MQARHLLFNRLADELLKEEIGPRLKKLTEHFPHANIEFVDLPGIYGAICRFQHTIRFPASVELKFSRAHDERAERFLCSYDLEILPVFMEFQKHDQFSSPLQPLNRAALIQWSDDKNVKFLETYLELEFADRYQRENQVTDPVSQTRLNRAFAVAKTNYKGDEYYFLSDDNRKLFEAAPERYVG